MSTPNTKSFRRALIGVTSVAAFVFVIAFFLPAVLGILIIWAAAVGLWLLGLHIERRRNHKHEMSRTISA